MPDITQTEQPHVKHIPAQVWYKSSKWELVAPLKTASGQVIPLGFITDGATIPLVFSGLFSRTGRYFKAAIAHDYALSRKLSWADATNLFRIELVASNIVTWRLWILLGGVRVWGILRRFIKGKV